jgi:hypothetical protein
MMLHPLRLLRRIFELVNTVVNEVQTRIFSPQLTFHGLQAAEMPQARKKW